MATISNNEIKIKYSLDTTDLANATALFDRLSAEDRQLLNDLKRLQAQLNATGQAGTAAGNNISNAARQNRKDFDLLGSSIQKIGGLIGTYFSVQALARFGKQVIDTTIKFEALSKAIEFTSGTITAGIINFKFLQKTAEELGLPLEAAVQGFKSFSAAAQRAGITIEQQQTMFLDLSKAMSALQVTSEDAKLIFLGLSQMMSKAKVSTQELVLQISERLPIGMEAAAIAVGRMKGEVKVTTSELMKLVSEGKILSEKFVPEFTKALGELAGDGAKVETLGKSFTRLGNAWDLMLYSMGNSTKGFIKDTVDGLTYAVNFLKGYFLGWQVEVDKQQMKAFENTVKKSEKLTNEQLEFRSDIAEKEKEIIQNQVAELQKLYDAQKAIQDSPLQREFNRKELMSQEEFANLEYRLKVAQIRLGDITGKVDGFTEALKRRNREKLVTEEDLDGTKKLENLYKKLIAQQEALMKAEEDLIKSRTKAGPNQDILILENRINFNNKMLAIDQDARFKELELAKNNAVKRKAELQKDAEEEQEIVRQARFKAFAAETEYLEKTLEFIRDNAKKRRQQLQTDEQNELEDSKALVNEKIKVLTEEYDKAKKIEAQGKDSLELLEMNYQDALTKLTEEGNRDREAIREKYRAKEKADLMKAELEVRSTVVEAATIRNVALAKSESEKASIAEEGAITQLNIKKEENTKLAKLQLEQGGLTEAQQKIINNKLEADNLLLDAQITQIVQQGEERRRKEREEKANKALEIGQTVADGLFDIYNQQLNNEITALNNKYNEEVRLADGNKQKLAELEQKKNEKEKELKIKQFRADQMAATARVIFSTASQIMASALNPALIPYIIGLSVAQLAAIAAQPVPEFAEGTKGKPFKGGPAIVGERGVEKVVTQSGKVYYTPPTATLIDLPKGSQVIPNHALNKKELFMANALNQGRPIGSDSAIVPKLDEIGGILKSLPVHQVNMNEKGFEKFIRTPRRTTKILNSQFPSKF